MAYLTKKQLEESLKEIKVRLKGLEDQLPESMTLESAITQVNEDVSKAKTLSEDVKSVLESINSQKQEAEQSKEKIVLTTTELEEEKKILLADKEDFEKFREEFEEMQDKTKQLQAETETQLGFVSAEKLANSFSDEAKKLKISVGDWFSKVKWSVAIFVLTVIGIICWQLSDFDTIFELSFLVRIAITTPIVWFLYFSVHNYNEEKSLLNNYLFKAAVARSFEAYRQLLRSQFEDYENVDEEGSNKLSKVQDKEIEFILDTIKGIYTSPIIDKSKDKITKKNLGPIEELLSIMERVKKF